MSRLTVLAVAAVLSLRPVASDAQEELDARSATLVHAEYRADLTLVHDKVVAMAEAIPAEKYAWRPAPDVRTVSEVLMHVAGEWYSICPMSVGGKPPADFGAPREGMRKLELVTAKAAVLEELAKSWAHCTAALASADPATLTGKYEPARMTLARAAMRVAGDQHEHLGQLITYARSVGVKPPWSR
jgi:uncharacterized damage-inducible protein DinB